MEKILKSPGLVHLAENIFNNLFDEAVGKYTLLDMVLSGQCRQDSKFLETVTVATVRLETVRQ